jgi:hypothetical protein
MSPLGQFLPIPEVPAMSDVPPMATKITDISGPAYPAVRGQSFAALPRRVRPSHSDQSGTSRRNRMRETRSSGEQDIVLSTSLKP